MPLAVIGLLAFAGLLHSLGNLLAKRGEDTQAFLWLVLAVAAIVGLVPFLIFSIIFAAPLPAAGWALVALSGALEALYYFLLGRAYQVGDFSLVYPLARGSAPLFATLIAAALSTLNHQEGRPSWAGAAGILLIVCGVYVLHVPAFDRKGLIAPLAAMRGGISRLALLIGLIIASYTVVDSVGVNYISPLPYLYLILAVAGLLLAPYMLLARGAAVRREWGKHSLRIIATAVFFLAAYLLVLFALRTTQVGYVSSVREVSVVFAALLGSVVLREPFAEKKTMGSLLIFAGILCIGLVAHS
jgi:drug/metabolite transporter (DMT)-like permease